jgi:sulfide dehydrogenase cytochrome subunit
MKIKTVLSPLTGLVLLSSQAGAGADMSQGAQLAATCAACHGPNGNDQGIPAIMGLDEQRIIAAMLAYRQSERPNHVMHAVAISLSDEELASVARYLAAHENDGNPP